MAKSKVGGSRAYLRGRIGSDVYSVGKDATGKRQQVVRSLAVQVSNPRTSNQMFGRMVMSTVMQAVSALSPIIDHSFDEVPNGQPSISEFIKRNYQLVKADALAHNAASNKFGLVKYQEKGAMSGGYIISVGKVVVPAALTNTAGDVQIDTSKAGTKAGEIREYFGLGDGGYITIVVLKKGAYQAEITRLKFADTLSDDTVISNANVGSLFTQEGNKTLTLAYSDGDINIVMNAGDDNVATGMIVTKKNDDGYVHSTAVMEATGDNDYTAAVALPTYPVGTEQFLNGGDL